MNYKKIDIENWDRRELFKLYTTDLKIVMNMTVDMDVTPLVKYVKRRGMRFYLTMMWAVSNIINAHEEFRYTLRDNGELWCWDYVSPNYTDFNPETGKFVKFATEYSTDLDTFHARAVEDCAKYKWESGFIPNQPENFFDITCLPWTRYKSFDLHVSGDTNKRMFPVVMWGKYEDEGGKFIMPVTVNFNHAAGDGYNLCRFFEELKTEIQKFEERK
jgi:chloramphenicol O-acetyltransferase type A